MATTPRMQFPFLAEAQAGADILYNESLAKMDSLINLTVKDRDLTTPPVSPAEGDTYLLEERTLTGDWSSFNGTAAQGTLTVDKQPTDTDTMTIDAKVYTFQTVLTDVDGNIEIGASLAVTQTNILNAINLTGTPGVGYAASMTIHPTVSATAFAANDMVLTAKVGGSNTNTIVTTETFTAGTNVFDAVTLGTTRRGADDLAIFKGGVWINLTLSEGFRMWVNDENKLLTYDGLAYLEQTFNSPGVISDLSDVNTAGVVDGQTLIFDFASGIWLPGASGGGGGNGIFHGAFIEHVSTEILNDTIDTIIDATNDWRDRFISAACFIRADVAPLSGPGEANDGDITLSFVQKTTSAASIVNAANQTGHPFPNFLSQGTEESHVIAGFYSANGRAQPNLSLTSDRDNVGPLTKFGIDFPTTLYVDTSGRLRVATKILLGSAFIIQMYFNIQAGPDLGGYA